MNRKALILLIILSFPTFVYSQDTANAEEVSYNTTSNLVYSENFSGAITMYKQMLNFDPKNPCFYYKLGFAYLNTFGKADSAVHFLNIAKKLYKPEYQKQVSKFDVMFYLARGYRVLEKNDSCIILLEELRMEYADDKCQNLIKTELSAAQKLQNRHLAIAELDTIINSANTDHSPVFSVETNTLMFTSRRNNPSSTKYDDEQFDEDIYYTVIKNGKWSEPKVMELFSTPENEATSSISADGKRMLIYKDEENGSIYYTQFAAGQWTAPQKFPRPINSRHRETHASMTENGQYIFFSSDRPGGYGGLDIWLCYKINETGQWSEPINLGDKINSKGDEKSPNISEDGHTLYFSSNGRPNSFGGFDIYKTTKNSFGYWEMPQNMGYPINSIGDDIFFSINESTQKAFYTSIRYESHGVADIFMVDIDTNNRVTNTVNTAYVYNATGDPLKDDIEINIINTKTKEKAIAKPNKVGKFVFITEPNSTYRLVIYKDNKIEYEDTISLPDIVPKERFYSKIPLPGVK